MRSPVPLLLLSLGIALSGCSKPADQKSGPRPVPVEAATAVVQTVPLDLATIGAVEAVSSVQLKAKVQGEILQTHFEDGSIVQAGQMLFTIDPRPFQAAVQRSEADLATAKAQAANAEEQLTRYRTLIDRGSASREQFSQYQATAEALKSTQAARQADLDEAKLSLEWSQVKAPITGRIGAALLKPGNIAQANTDVLAVINQIQPIYVTFSLPEGVLADVRRRLQDGRPTVKAADPSTGRALGQGELTFVDNAVDRASGMVAFRATFPNDREDLWPGQFVDVVLHLSEQKDVLVIPATSVMEGQEGSNVYLIRDGKAVLQAVEIERLAGDIAVVAGGLEAGEVVISTGQLRVSPGSPVKVEQPQPPAQP